MSILERIEARLKSKRYAKYKSHQSFYTLTEDEQSKVLKKHTKFRRYWLLHSAKMRIIMKQLDEALSIGSYIADSKNSILQVESLDLTLKQVRFDMKHLKLM